jgi:signal peptidase I
MERFEWEMTEPARLKGDGFGVASQKSKEGGGLWETIKVIIQALLIALVIRTLLFQPFNIPSGSLIPTLLVGDYLFVSKYSYGYSHYSLPSFLDLAPSAMPGRFFASQPKRGDIIVFKLPRDGETDYIKRLIGLPGDKIQMIHGRLYINGAIVERTPLSPYATADRFGHAIQVPRYEETLPGGVKHEIIQIDGDDQGQAKTNPGGLDVNNTGVYDVPPGQYFMMGDNRDDSLDSRFSPAQDGVGYVPFENLIGRAEIIFFSVEAGESAWQVWRWPSIVRWRRLFQPVR